jgi:ketosteroid isomerase-like protein
MSDAEVERNRRVVLDQLAAMDRGDVDAQLALMTEDVRWWIPASASAHAALPRPLVGRAAVGGLLGSAPERFTQVSVIVDRVIAEGDHVAVMLRVHAGTVSGNDYEGEYLWAYRLADGLIAEMWEYLDTAYAFEKLS